MSTNDQAGRTARRARQTADDARSTADEATRATERGIAEAGYAALGAVDAAVAFARKAGNELPALARRTPEFLERARTDMASRVDELSARGRALTGQVRPDPQVREAGDRVDTATRQAKGAATSAGRAAKAQAEAGRKTADKVGDGRRTRRPAKRTAKKATAKKATAPRAETTRSSTSRETAASPPAQPAGTGPLEDRTVDELYQRATDLDVEGRSSMSKDELVEAIRDQQ